MDLVPGREPAQQLVDVASTGVVGLLLGQEKRYEKDFHGALLLIALK
jgi:hypothetical protein